MKKIVFFIGLFLLTIYSFGQTKITSEEVNFRTSPEIKENKISIIPKGTIVNIIQDTIEFKNWTKINYIGKIGYINNSLLKNISTNLKKYDDNINSSKRVKYYKNSNGDRVQSPTHYNSVPTGASALCNDGTYSFSRSRRGTCSHHGDVKKWL